MEFGRSAVEFGQGAMEFGQGAVEFGRGAMEFGRGAMEFGQGAVEFGQDAAPSAICLAGVLQRPGCAVAACCCPVSASSCWSGPATTSSSIGRGRSGGQPTRHRSATTPRPPSPVPC